MTKQALREKIIRGCWQLSQGHSLEPSTIDPILDAVECGFTTFDCADIYLGVEELLGKAAEALPGKKLRIHTKFVPDLNRLETIDFSYVEQIIDRSLKRLQTDRLDLVQFHWWDWEIKNYLPALEYLSILKEKGKIAKIGLTNVNKTYLEEISNRFDIHSLQVQLSLFDKRVRQGVAELCKKKNIQIYAYGSLLGGFLSEKWLGAAEPLPNELENRSLVKYKLMIDSACGWSEFQNRLQVLKKLSVQYGCELSNIALAALLEGLGADAAIIGLSPRHYKSQNRSLQNLPLLSEKDLKTISDWPSELQGDVYDQERDKKGAHAKIMKYNLNAQ